MILNKLCHEVSYYTLITLDNTDNSFQHKHVTENETNQNNDFSNKCQWFFDIKLSIHYGKDKTISIPFGTKQIKKNWWTIYHHTRYRF